MRAEKEFWQLRSPGDFGEGCFNEMARAWGQKLDWSEFKGEWKVRKYKQLAYTTPLFR